MNYLGNTLGWAVYHMASFPHYRTYAYLDTVSGVVHTTADRYILMALYVLKYYIPPTFLLPHDTNYSLQRRQTLGPCLVRKNFQLKPDHYMTINHYYNHTLSHTLPPPDPVTVLHIFHPDNTTLFYAIYKGNLYTFRPLPGASYYLEEAVKSCIENDFKFKNP